MTLSIDYSTKVKLAWMFAKPVISMIKTIVIFKILPIKLDCNITNKHHIRPEKKANEEHIFNALRYM